MEPVDRLGDAVPGGSGSALAPAGATWDALAARVAARLATTDDTTVRRVVAALSAALEPFAEGGEVTSVESFHLMLASTAAGLYAAAQDAQQRQRVALHEAGHAATAVALGIPLDLVSIAPDPVRGSLGCVRACDTLPPGGAFTPDARLAVERHILVQLAGPLAEEMGGCRPEREEWQRHEQLAARLALLVRPPLSDPECWAFVAWLDVRARSLLTQYWPGVLALRDALLAETTIRDGARAASLVHDALRADTSPHRTE